MHAGAATRVLQRNSLGGRSMNNERSKRYRLLAAEPPQNPALRAGGPDDGHARSAGRPPASPKAWICRNGRRNTSRASPAPAEFDTAAECAKVVPLDYKGRLTYWYTGPTDAAPEIDQADRRGVLGGLEGDLPEHRDRRAEHQLQRPARQVPHGRCSAMPARWSCACRSSAASSSRPRATCRS